MPQLNAMAVNIHHPLYLALLKGYCLRDANGVFQRSFKIDWDQDGLGDAGHAYISIVPQAPRDTLVNAVERLVSDFGVDSIFLNETCNVFYNDPAWDLVEGVRRMVRDVRRRWSTPGKRSPTVARASAATNLHLCKSGPHVSSEVVVIWRSHRQTARPAYMIGRTSSRRTSARTRLLHSHVVDHAGRAATRQGRHSRHGRPGARLY